VLRLRNYPIDEGVVALPLVSRSLDVLAEKEAAAYRDRAHDTAVNLYGIPPRIGRPHRGKLSTNPYDPTRRVIPSAATALRSRQTRSTIPSGRGVCIVLTVRPIPTVAAYESKESEG